MVKLNWNVCCPRQRFQISKKNQAVSAGSPVQERHLHEFTSFKIYVIALLGHITDVATRQSLN
jgi:hypothetical protein